MNLKRLGALVVAVALVAGAFVARSRLDESQGTSGGTGGAGSGATGSTSDPAAGGTPDGPPATALVCITELRSVCDAVAAARPDLAVAVEPAGETLDRLAALADPSEAPIWLTIDPYPAMVDVLRVGSGELGLAREVLATSPLAVAVPTGRGDVLTAACAGQPLWSCIGDVAGDPWSDLGGEATWSAVRPSLGDVEDSAIGLASFAGVVADLTGRPTFDEGDWSGLIPELRALARTSQRAPNSGGTPLATMATGRAVDVAASAEFELAELGASGERFELVYPGEGMWMQAVVAVPAGQAAPDDLVADVATHLSAAGWQAPAESGRPLPGAAVAVDLRELWEELT